MAFVFFFWKIRIKDLFIQFVVVVQCEWNEKEKWIHRTFNFTVPINYFFFRVFNFICQWNPSSTCIFYELKWNTFNSLRVFFSSFLPRLKSFDDDERNHAVAKDEEINKFVCPEFFLLLLLLQHSFSHLLIATILPSSQCVSFSNRILSSIFQETNTLSLKLFSSSSFSSKRLYLFCHSPCWRLTPIPLPLWSTTRKIIRIFHSLQNLQLHKYIKFIFYGHSNSHQQINYKWFSKIQGSHCQSKSYLNIHKFHNDVFFLLFFSTFIWKFSSLQWSSAQHITDGIEKRCQSRFCDRSMRWEFISIHRYFA